MFVTKLIFVNEYGLTDISLSCQTEILYHTNDNDDFSIKLSFKLINLSKTGLASLIPSHLGPQNPGRDSLVSELRFLIT